MMRTFPNARDCEHGSQRGKCVECEVTQLRAELAAAKALADAHQEQASRYNNEREAWWRGREAELIAATDLLNRSVDFHVQAVAEAREEQREACARPWDGAVTIKTNIAAFIRATPLSATTLATRIAELEAERDALQAHLNHLDSGWVNP